MDQPRVYCCLHHIELRAIVVMDDDAIEAHWRINSGLHGDKHWHARVSVLTHAITLSSRTHTHSFVCTFAHTGAKALEGGGLLSIQEEFLAHGRMRFLSGLAIVNLRESLMPNGSESHTL